MDASSAKRKRAIPFCVKMFSTPRARPEQKPHPADRNKSYPGHWGGRYGPLGGRESTNEKRKAAGNGEKTDKAKNDQPLPCPQFLPSAVGLTRGGHIGLTRLKISDGYGERAPIEVEVFQSWQSVVAQQVAVRCIAGLDGSVATRWTPNE
jgi:hypothetical protein